jgi:type II secretory pathway pseudopilin PulG
MKSLPVIASHFVIASEAKQSGFGLLELMLAAMIAAGISLGYLYNQSRQSAISQAQSQAGYYQMVSDAVAKYMANNYDQLKAITKPQTCSNPQLFTDATAAPAPTGCGIQALFLSGSASSPVANGLQPTLTDLKTTGYLDANFSNSFLWPTQLTMYTASGVSTGSSYAAPEYRVQIQAWCNGAAPANDTVCVNPVLHSMVYNAQPFADSTTNSFINFTRQDKLLQARTALGANAFVSYDWALKKDAFLYSDGDKNQLTNLLKFTSGSDSGIGIEGVLALQATYIPAQVFSSPTPGPTPPMLPGKIPFSECDPTKDTYASGNAITYRLLPFGLVDKTKPEPTSNNASNCKALVVYPIAWEASSVPGFRAHWVRDGVNLTCRANGPAVSWLDDDHYCNIPPEWKYCTVKVINDGGSNPNYPYVKYTPDKSRMPAYCWQPFPAIPLVSYSMSSIFGGSPNPPDSLPYKQEIPYYLDPAKCLLPYCQPINYYYP